jgi:hypothetical protein
MRNGDGRVMRSGLLEVCSGGNQLNTGAELCVWRATLQLNFDSGRGGGYILAKNIA